MKKIILILSLIILGTTVFAQIPDGYYDGTEGLTGDDLKFALHFIIDHHTSFSYSDVADYLKYTDEDPNNSDNIIMLYTGRSSPKSNNGGGANQWNKEHVWAKSHGNFGTSQPAGTDLHNIRPADASVNSSRGHRHFDEGGTQHSEATECYYTDDTWEPRDAVKGDVARMIFYMATRYKGDAGNEPDLEVVDYIPSDASLPYHAMLSTLLIWNEQDPPDDFEINRNEVIYGFQGNRNPYIDHPEWVQCVFGIGCNSLIFSSSPITEIMETTEYTYNITYNTNEEDENIECTEKPSWLEYSEDETTNTATLTGTPSVVGNYDVTLRLSELDDTVFQSFTIVVSPYSNTQEIINVDFASCLPSNWSTYNVSGDHDWQCGNQAIEINAYGSDVACDDWLISPAINLDLYENEVLTFDTYNEYDDDGITAPAMKLKYSTDYTETSNPENATWTNLTYAYQTINVPTFTPSGDVDLSTISGSNVYLAYHYTSSGTGTDESTLWKVDNILLMGDVIANTNEIKSENNFNIYPNPSSNGIFNINSNILQEAQILIFDVNGKVITSKSISNQENTIDISNAGSGLFFIKIETENSINWGKIIIK